MMIDPSVKKLMEGSNPENPRFESRYSLVIAAAKRAREICKTGVSFTERVVQLLLALPDGVQAMSMDMLLNMYLEEDRNKKAQ